MGTATPKTGQIAFSDLNTGILNAGSTASLNMNTAAQRMGYSTTGQVSISLLRGCSGGTISIAFQPPTKFVPGFYGYSAAYGLGSITGATYQSPFLVQSLTGPGSPSTVTSFFLADGSYNAPTSPWQGTDVTRACTADTSRTITGTTASGVDITYTMPTTGSLTWGLKFG